MWQLKVQVNSRAKNTRRQLLWGLVMSNLSLRSSCLQRVWLLIRKSRNKIPKPQFRKSRSTKCWLNRIPKGKWLTLNSIRFRRWNRMTFPKVTLRSSKTPIRVASSLPHVVKGYQLCLTNKSFFWYKSLTRIRANFGGHLNKLLIQISKRKRNLRVILVVSLL